MAIAFRSFAVFTALTVVVMAEAQPRGYQARACGFDMNRNGIRGESADCNVCDGQGTDAQSGEHGWQRDVDNDAGIEDEYYVDCGSGNDTTGDGTPGNPWKTIAYAFNTGADATGEEDIICFKGTCDAEGEDVHLELAHEVAGTYSVPATGNQVRAWDYPANPAMIVGWDSDNDGCYPPFDTGTSGVPLCDVGGTGDTAIISGATNNYNRTWYSPEYFEAAHFVVQNYGDGNGDTTGVSGFAGVRDFNYYHDIELNHINSNTIINSSGITFNMFSGPDHTAFENIKATNIGSYFTRGSGGDGPAVHGPLRYQNITLTVHGYDLDTKLVPIAKLWGYTTGIEFLDNEFDCNLAAWTPGVGSGACQGQVAAQCSQDWDIINNAYTDYVRALAVQGASSNACTSPGRVVDDVIFDRNLFVNNALTGHQAATAVQMTGWGDTPVEQFHNVTVSNNFFHWNDPQWMNGVLYLGRYLGAGTVAATINIIGNTFVGDIETSVGPVFVSHYKGYVSVDPAGAEGAMHDTFVIKNNIMGGGDLTANRCRNIHFDPEPGTTLLSDNNVFDSDCDFFYVPGQDGTLLLWQADSGTDAGSVVCGPTYVDSANDDFHLADDDTCARDNGINASADLGCGLACYDYDGDTRPDDGTWDIGADEATGGPGPGGTPPDPPTNLHRADTNP